MNKRLVGRKYEALAVEFLTARGYVILEKNYQDRWGEIDILAERDGVLIACEVKYRRSGQCGDPLEAVDIRKQKRISRTLLSYYAKHGYGPDMPCRFDVIAVNGEGTVQHVEDAFTFQR